MKASTGFIARFLSFESAGGILLMVAAAVALVFANSPLAGYYELFLSTPVEVRIGDFEIAKPLLLWINDGLMAVFFMLVGLELKRELIEGELSDKRNIVLPAVGALGGMLVPALIYVYFNFDDPAAIQGWAIPAATDIAFALGILSLLGSRVPITIKIFLTSLAIFDDIGAIIIIAIFYTSKVSSLALLVAFAATIVLWTLNRRGVVDKSPYMLVGLVMWVSLLKSGVHATLAGVVIAMFIPLTTKTQDGISPLKSLEHDLHSIVAFVILPVFAFANAGISFKGVGLEQLGHGVPMGIAFGLFFGKQIGIFGLCYLALKFQLAKLPDGMSLSSLYGTAALCGVGFTMSLFIGSLAFEETGVNSFFDERLGILLGSLLSGIVGFLVLAKVLPAASRS
jgi:NhaA family Na+:H+ antiporter